MTILEAASCEAPIMLRDLDLYKVILEEIIGRQRVEKR